jgi:predicted amidohydrolase YtcJ
MTIERFSIALLLLPGLALAAVVPPADLVLFHGNIHTQDSNRSVVQALAIRGNTIVAVGTAEFVSGLIGPKTQMVDLAGRTALPGIIDAHTHPPRARRNWTNATSATRS